MNDTDGDGRNDATSPDSLSGSWGPLSSLPGHPMMWILIVSEVLVFGGALIALSGARMTDPELFAQSQQTLDRFAGAINTMVLLTSGLAAALAVTAQSRGNLGPARAWLFAAMALGIVFLGVKAVEYWQKAQAGIGFGENTFYSLYYLTTGFHALHVVAGIGILAFVAWKNSLENIETGTAFWHMVDLIWVLLFPIVYLMR